MQRNRGFHAFIRDGVPVEGVDDSGARQYRRARDIDFREVDARQLLDGLFTRGSGDVGIEPFEAQPQLAFKDGVALRVASEGAARAERLAVVRVGGVPSEDVMEMVSERLLNEPVFAVDAG